MRVVRLVKSRPWWTSTWGWKVGLSWYGWMRAQLLPPSACSPRSVCVSPTGQPYNQLAILASSKGDHLTTIFYYCRSIAVKFPFPAASTNLQKALSKALER